MISVLVTFYTPKTLQKIYKKRQKAKQAGKSQGNSIPGKSQGIVREFFMGQGKLKMLWKVREKSGNFERVMAMVVSWVIWNTLDNILINCWWSCWHQWQITCLVQHWQLYHMQQGLNSQGTHHISPLWVNYEVLLMRILKKTVML